MFHLVLLAAAVMAMIAAGEDLGAPSSADVLPLVGQQMRSVQQRMADRDTSAPTQQLQLQIVDELSQLVEQLERKCRGERSAAQAEPSSAASSPNPSQRPASDSLSRPGQQAISPPSPAAALQLNRRAWGHLPPQQRQSVLNADFEIFLPQYKELIQRYFQRLAEEPDNPP